MLGSYLFFHDMRISTLRRDRQEDLLDICSTCRDDLLTRDKDNDKCQRPRESVSRATDGLFLRSNKFLCDHISTNFSSML